MRFMKTSFSIFVFLAVGPAAGHAGQVNMTTPRAGTVTMPHSGLGSQQPLDKSAPQEGLSLNFSHVQTPYRSQNSVGAKSAPPHHHRNSF